MVVSPSLVQGNQNVIVPLLYIIDQTYPHPSLTSYLTWTLQDSQTLCISNWLCIGKPKKLYKTKENLKQTLFCGNS